jgi:hypothetical protein
LFVGPTYPDPYVYFVKRFAQATMSINALASKVISEKIYPFSELINSTLDFSLSTAQETALKGFYDELNVNRFTTYLGEAIAARDYIRYFILI